MKKTFIFYAIFLFALHSWGQTFYVKLKEPIEDSQSLLQKVNQEFTVTFVKNNLTSRLLNAHIYKISHTLNKSDAERLHQLLKDDPATIYSSLMYEPVPAPNDIPPTTPSFVGNQGYLYADPGVNAEYAWSQGADGSNVSVHVLEYAILTEHEEFVGRNLGIEEGMTISDQSNYYAHGTATAGVIYSHNGNYGTTGIAYNAASYTLYPEWQQGIEWDRILALSNAVNAAREGDVLVYEMQWADEDGDYVPAEYDPLVWDLTKAATDNGLIVVAAAGNGEQNLDLSEHDDYTNLGDSGAIIVGASMPDVSHQSLSFSTHGSRVNINAWGTDVTTTGYSQILIGNDLNQSYTNFYGGTSSATAVSGGCVTAIQSFYYNLTGGQYLTSVEMRDLLEETGIQGPTNDRLIGKFINMKAAIERLVVLSAEDENFSNGFVVFPNPANNLIKVKSLTNIENIKLELYNYLGKLIVSQESSEQTTELDISNLSQGMYILKISSGDKIGYKKILKN